MVQVCEDANNGRIVGGIIASPQTFVFNGESLRFGLVDDVATIPEYQQQGIAKRLLQMAEDYYAEEGFPFSILSADPEGHPRKHLYLPCGYEDYAKVRLLVGFPSVPALCRNLPPFIIFSPLMLFSSVVYYPLKYAEYKRCEAEFPAEIQHGGQNLAFRDAWNDIGARYYEGFIPSPEDDWRWRRERVPTPNLVPSYVTFRHNARIIAGASLNYVTLNYYLGGTRVRLRQGLVHECFVDFRELGSSGEFPAFLDYFFHMMLNIASQRGIAILFFEVAPNNAWALAGAKRMGFLHVPAGMCMVKQQGDRALPPFDQLRRPLFVPTLGTLGYP
jgi:hypothetical protein